MKLNRKSFGVKLWLYFILFSAIIFGALWLLQTVFLQSFYNRMAIRNVENAADQILAQRDFADIEGVIDDLAYDNSLLVFLTDRQGTVFYSADEYSYSYKKYESHRPEDGSGGNPYWDKDQPLNWQIGAFRNLPDDYGAFLKLLGDSPDGRIGYQLEDQTAYICGAVLPASGANSNLLGGQEVVLYISAPLGAVSAAVNILRIQLIWVTLASLVVGLVIAFFIARRFARPVSAITRQAKRMADGDFEVTFETGFCSELDELSDTLGQTAVQLSQAESFRRAFLANVSHDLRTPLTMIRGYAEMVRDISWEDSGQREADLSIIIRESDRLTGLVNEILDYSALQAGKQASVPEEFDMSETVQSVISQFEPWCRQEHYRIETAIAPGLSVTGDRTQLERVLYNLIDNALCHTGDSRRIQIVLTDAGNAARIEVRDWGNGILSDELPHIWERYVTAKKRRQTGSVSGLGLAIAKEILLLHKARFGVESNIGQGSLFWFEISY